MKQSVDHYRQGDVPLQRIDALPAGFAPVAPDEHNKLVLALGEATGHHHRFENCFSQEGTVRMFRDFQTGAQIIEVLAEPMAGGTATGPAMLVHEEHDPITLAPGFYRQLLQVEDDGEMILQVAD